MKKVLALILTLSLLLACGLARADQAPVFNAYDETVSITVMGVDEKDNATIFDSSKHDRASANENAWIDAYKNYLNIDVKRIVPEDSTALNANLNTMMASGDLPDMMIVSKDMFYTLAENGVLKDVSEVFDSYDGALWMEIKNSFTDDVWQTGVYEGEMLGIPYTENFYNSTSVMWIRQDWLDKVGMTVPATLDELEAVAQAFIDNKLGGDKTIGIGLTPVGDWGGDFSSIMAAYGVPLTTWVEKDGRYAYANTLDENKDGLLRLQSMYKKGLFKSDFSVSNIRDEEVANGVCGLYFAPGWHGVTSINASLLNDENAVWTAAPIPTLDGQRVVQTTNAGVGRYLVFNESCEHADAFFRMKELEAYVYYYATPEEDIYALRSVTDPDGSIFASWNLMVFRGSQRGDLDLYKAKLMCDAWDAGVKSGDELPVMVGATYDKIIDGVNGNRNQLRLYHTYIEGYRIVNEILAEGKVQGGYNGPLTENMTLYQTTINDELNAAMVKVIMGEDISVYEKAVESWYANGGQAITDDVNAYYGK